MKSIERERFTKTIKLELVPIDATKKAMEKSKCMEADNLLREKASNLHPIIDYVSKKIITDALKLCLVDFKKLYNFKILSKQKDAGQKEKKAYQKELEKALNSITKTVTNYKLEGLKSVKNLCEAKFLSEGLPNLIRYADDIDAETKALWLKNLENTTGLTTLLTKFCTTRTTAITVHCPKRVIENFEIYARNIKFIEEFLNSEYSKEFCEQFPRFEDLKYPDFYEFCLSPEQIDHYNQYISGIYSENGECIAKGYNQFIQEINTKNRRDVHFNGVYFGKLEKLKQQILIPKAPLFKVDCLGDDEDLRTLLRELLDNYNMDKIHKMIQFMTGCQPGDLSVRGSQLHQLSHMVYGIHELIPNKIIEKFIENQEKRLLELNDDKKKTLKERKSIQQNIENASLKVQEERRCFSLAEINNIIMNENIFDSYKEKLSNDYTKIKKSIAAIMNSNILGDGKLREYYKNKEKIKQFLECLLELRKDLLFFSYSEGGNQFVKDTIAGFDEELSKVVPAFNMTRNYLTKKVGEMVKEYQICFGTPTKLATRWWNGGKFQASTESIARIDGKYYYFCVGHKQKPFCLKEVEENSNNSDIVWVFNQKTSVDASKHFPAVVFNKDVKEFFEKDSDNLVYTHANMLKHFEVTREEYLIYKEKTFSKAAVAEGRVTQKQQKRDQNILIDLYKRFVEVYPHYSRFCFNFQETESYADIGVFMADCNTCMVDSSWVAVDRSHFNSLVSSGNMYLFLIKNKNMYTPGVTKTSFAEIFLAMMSDENFAKGNIRINAKPKISFRPAVIPFQITHPKGSILVNKRTKSGKFIPPLVYIQIYNYLNKKCDEQDLSESARLLLSSGEIVQKLATEDISKNLRYMMDKFFITFSYVKNAKISERQYSTISHEVLHEMQNGYRTLTVVPGNTHLLYYTLYDWDGKTILQEGSFDTIDNERYADKIRLLMTSKKNRMSSDWTYDISINNIKEPYIRHCVRKILEIALTNQAVICIEKQNDSYKTKTFVDNTLYKMLENKLEKRLADCYIKDHDGNTYGSLLQPLQLARVDINSMSFQNGILFKIPGAYSSNMCYTTGFVNLFDFSSIKSMSSKKKFLEKFEQITYLPDKGLFAFHFNYEAFKVKKNIEKKDWTVYVGKTFSYYKKNKEDRRVHRVDDAGKKLFELLQAGESLINNTVDASKLKLSEADALYQAFRRTVLITTVESENTITQPYQSSPVTDSDEIKLLPEQVKCRNLALKLRYHIELNESEEESNKYDYTEKWINYAISHKQG